MRYAPNQATQTSPMNWKVSLINLTISSSFFNVPSVRALAPWVFIDSYNNNILILLCQHKTANLL